MVEVAAEPAYLAASEIPISPGPDARDAVPPLIP